MQMADASAHCAANVTDISAHAAHDQDVGSGETEHHDMVLLMMEAGIQCHT